MAFECQYCGKSLSRRHYLNRHIRNFHPYPSKNGPSSLSTTKVGDIETSDGALVSGLRVAGLTGSTAYMNPIQNNPERLQLTPQQPLPDPLATSLSSLDRTMQDVLQNHTPGDDYTKAQLYSQVLQRYLRQADQYRERPLGKVSLKEIEWVEDDKPDKDVSQIKELLRGTLPPSLIRGGTTLAETLADLPEVNWDDKLQLIVDGKTVENSNIVDLLSDLGRKKKTSKPPKGMNELLTVFKERNIARSLIPNEARWSSLASTQPVRGVASRKVKSKLRKDWMESKY